MDQNGSKFVDFIKLMKLDGLIMLFIFSYVSQGVTVTQLMEDKMCLNQLNHDKDFCSSLTGSHYNESSTRLVLKTADSFKNYQFIILNGPALILSIFIGFWLGNYPNYIRMMIIAPFVAGIFSITILLVNSYFYSFHYWYILLAYVPLALAGGSGLIFSSVYTYISWSAPSNLVIIRFAIVEFVCQVACMIGTYVGGLVLGMHPWVQGQFRNYIGVFIVGLISQIIGLIYACSVRLDHIPETKEDKRSESFVDMLRDVFNISRLSQPVKILMKKRPKNGRLWLSLLLIAGAVDVASFLGEDGIAFQFAQRVYGLTEDQYTTINALVFIVPALMTSVGPLVLRSLLGLSDPTIAIFGTLSMVTLYLVRGVILTLRGYIIGYLGGSFYRVPLASVRSLITLIVDHAECAQIFTLATALEGYISLGATLVYTTVFSLTIDTNPGAIMILMACVQLYPLIVFVATFFNRSQWKAPPSTDQREKKLQTQ